MGKAKKILKGKFPEKAMSLDDQVRVINKIGKILLEDYTTGMDFAEVDLKVNNFALWLGGLHPDLQVYAFQLLLNYHQIEFDANEKTEARMARLEERIGIGTKLGYKEETFELIAHYPWPIEFLDGTTFEERLDALANEVREEQALDIVTVDMVLTGVHRARIEDISQCYAVVVGCVEHIKQTSDIRRQEQIQRFNDWLEHQLPDMKTFGQFMLGKIS